MRRPLPLLLLAFAAFSCDAATIRLRADEWYPYNGQPGAASEGYMIDLARRIAAEHGDAIDYQTMDWAGAVRAALAGTVDCVVGATAVDARGLVLTPEPFGRTINTFFVLRENPWHYRQPSDLERVRIGATFGYSYGATVDAWFARAPKERVLWVRDNRRALPTLFARLLSGKIDAVVDDHLVGGGALTQLGLADRIRRAGNAPEVDDLFLACTPGERGERYAQQFAVGLRRLRDSGELAAILTRYGMSDWLMGP
jgi:polar amino acid transport system substrate-binding protein